MKSAYLLIDSRGPEIQHRSGLTAPDNFLYVAEDGASPVVFFDAREFDVMKGALDDLQNGVEIERIEPYLKKVLSDLDDPLVAAAVAILRAREVEEVQVSPFLPYAFGQQLESAGIKVVIYDYAREREHKEEMEINNLIAAQRVNESAFDFVWQILKESTIEGDSIMYEGEVLTSEYVKSEVRKLLLDQGYDCPDGIIVASGPQTAEPHNEGSGSLLPNECIIVDIFPRSQETGYFADMTRTFVKGKPSQKIQDLFEAVEDVQGRIADELAIGRSCSEVHQDTVSYFKEKGFEASPKKGFMHGTGHSLGLALHEGPRLAAQSTSVIERGMVFTVEPGLYYPGVGGVRIEDVVLFHADGKKENITQFNKPFLIA